MGYGQHMVIQHIVRNCCKCAEIPNRLPRKPLVTAETAEVPFEEAACWSLKETRTWGGGVTQNTLKPLASSSRHGIIGIQRQSSEEFEEFCKSYGILLDVFGTRATL